MHAVAAHLRATSTALGIDRRALHRRVDEDGRSGTDLIVVESWMIVVSPAFVEP
jgi:hypothetical protein